MTRAATTVTLTRASTGPLGIALNIGPLLYLVNKFWLAALALGFIPFVDLRLFAVEAILVSYVRGIAVYSVWTDVWFGEKPLGFSMTD